MTRAVRTRHTEGLRQASAAVGRRRRRIGRACPDSTGMCFQAPGSSTKGLSGNFVDFSLKNFPSLTEIGQGVACHSLERLQKAILPHKIQVHPCAFNVCCVLDDSTALLSSAYVAYGSTTVTRLVQGCVIALSDSTGAEDKRYYLELPSRYAPRGFSAPPLAPDSQSQPFTFTDFSAFSVFNTPTPSQIPFGSPIPSHVPFSARMASDSDKFPANPFEPRSVTTPQLNRASEHFERAGEHTNIILEVNKARADARGDTQPLSLARGQNHCEADDAWAIEARAEDGKRALYVRQRWEGEQGQHSLLALSSGIPAKVYSCCNPNGTTFDRSESNSLRHKTVIIDKHSKLNHSLVQQLDPTLHGTNNTIQQFCISPMQPLGS
ncbi:hypothetical protein B0H16DRAFT_1450447 [Mycena metata]|uniref:Uncharacterized protein n=1 Tax=Mycena metata TaxID=1033252 RepID=A0AAD7JZD2_9AGAR|nr:hypothetical protein B0H16DRAFT_1450447 [Mycena metata]